MNQNTTKQAADTNAKRVVHAYVEAMNAGDFEQLKSLFAPDAEIVGVTGSGSVDYAMPVWKALHEGLQMELTIDDIIGEGDVVAVRFTERGRWVGPFLGYDQPTGKPFDMTAIEWFVLENGLIKRRWGVRDSAAQARQIGLVPKAA
ncbi:putative ester cyclase [Kaistia hirudinis]|uniref:Putative ester cyclase n=1 Tax=Kaistia hirudinis TaxID=1293440 RepID=A0A840AQX6_9HYPH|nr:ester cyclase [Kaistia hirudinis]MBB3930766.1 putative ester cyclase [Kaistia hirudinis]